MASFRRLERVVAGFLLFLLATSLWVGFQWTPSPQSRREILHATSSTRLWHRQKPNPFADWMIQYLDWHSQVMTKDLTPETWMDYKYLVLRCYRSDQRCGGLSDRLKPIPLVLLAASRSKRLLLIHWDRPFPLEEFLVSPSGGFQWSVPTWLAKLWKSHKKQRTLTRAGNVLNETSFRKDRILHAKIQDTWGGETQYDGELGDKSFATIFHDLFRIFFAPSPPIRRILGSKIQESNLTIGDYSVAHYRAEYGKEVQRHPKLLEPKYLTQVAHNSIRCASELQPERQAPIYFASDNPVALQAIRDLRGHTKYPLVTFDRQDDVPLHLDTFGNGTQPKDFFSTFLDLLLAGNGKCVTYGKGGFGRLAALLSFNESCSRKHIQNFRPITCVGRAPFQSTTQRAPQ